MRMLKLALAAVLTMGVVGAYAMDQFPDVPDNHWAYEALENMRAEGILVGYPDGLFRGSRPLSRYELAVAINAAYMRLMGVTDGLKAQIDELEDMVADIDIPKVEEVKPKRIAVNVS